MSAQEQIWSPGVFFHSVMQCFLWKERFTMGGNCLFKTLDLTAYKSVNKMFNRMEIYIYIYKEIRKTENIQILYNCCPPVVAVFFF